MSRLICLFVFVFFALTSGKYIDENPQAAVMPPPNGTMVYGSGELLSTGGGASIAAHASQLLLAVGVAIVLL